MKLQWGETRSQATVFSVHLIAQKLLNSGVCLIIDSQAQARALKDAVSVPPTPYECAVGVPVGPSVFHTSGTFVFSVSDTFPQH